MKIQYKSKQRNEGRRSLRNREKKTEESIGRMIKEGEDIHLKEDGHHLEGMIEKTIVEMTTAEGE